MGASVSTVDDLSDSLTGRRLRAERTMPATRDELLVSRQGGWLDDAARKFASLLQLQPGWDSHGARQLSTGTIQEAFDLAARLQALGLPEPEIVPTSVGGVQFEWDAGGVELELELRPGGGMLAIFESAETGESWDRELPPQDLAAIVGALERLARPGRRG